MRACTLCGVEREESEFATRYGQPRTYCKVCQRENMRQWRLKNPERAKARAKANYQKHREYNLARSREHYRANKEAHKRTSRRAWLRNNYGMTIAEYDEMLAAQENKCAICRGECRSGYRLAVDHCHESGLIRGLLCRRCNQAIGLMEEDRGMMFSAIRYLERAVAEKSKTAQK